MCHLHLIYEFIGAWDLPLSLKDNRDADFNLTSTCLMRC